MRLTRRGRAVVITVVCAASFAVGAYGPLWDALGRWYYR